jgi:hypothetical protein
MHTAYIDPADLLTHSVIPICGLYLISLINYCTVFIMVLRLPQDYSYKMS